MKEISYEGDFICYNNHMKEVHRCHRWLVPLIVSVITFVITFLIVFVFRGLY